MRYLLVLVLGVCSMQLNAQTQPTYASSTMSFPVTNLEKSIEWYKQVLGNVEYFSPAEGVTEFMLNENTWLQLFEFEGQSSSAAIMRLEVGDIRIQHNRLQKLGLSPSPVELVPEVVSYFDFKDPDGNQLSFYQMETQ